MPALDLRDIQSLPPHSKMFMDLEIPVHRARIAYIVCSLCMALMWPVFLLRVYCKLRISHMFGLDDVATVLAVVGCTAYAISVFLGMKMCGPHAWTVALTMVDFEIMKMSFPDTTIYISELAYGPTIFFAKLSLLLLYLKLFFCKQTMKRLVYAGIVVCGLYYAIQTLAFGIMCVHRPAESWIDPAFKARCHQAIILKWTQGIFGLFSDIYIFMLPLPLIWALQVSLRQKLGVLAVFATGFLAVLASMLGLYYCVASAENPDVNRVQPPQLILCVVELTAGVICGSLPHTVVFFRKRRLEFLRTTAIRQYVGFLRGYFQGRKRRPSPDFDDSNQIESQSAMSDKGKLCIETRLLGPVQGSAKLSKLSDDIQDLPENAGFLQLGSTRST